MNTFEDIVTVTKETNYFHPDMYRYNQGHGQFDIISDLKDELSEAGITVDYISKIGEDGKEYITHLSYTGLSDKVNEVVNQHEVIEAEIAEVA